jgi:hypothetical protein
LSELSRQLRRRCASRRVPVSTPEVAPTAASVTAFCEQCWRDLPPDDIERIAARVLQAVMPGGRFLDHRDASP